MTLRDEVDRIRKDRDSKVTLDNLTPTESRALATAAIGDLQRAKRQGQQQSPVAKQRATEHVSAVVQQARIMKAATEPMIPAYNSAGELLGAIPPDRMTTFDPGAVTYNVNSQATGLIGVGGQWTAFADGPAAVTKAVKGIASEAVKVAKQLQARRVTKAQRPANPQTNAFDYLCELGETCYRQTVTKAQKSGQAAPLKMPPLVMAGLYYDEASATVQKAIRARLAQCDEESRQVARHALARVTRNFLAKTSKPK